MEKKYIEKTNGKLRAKVEDDGYGVSLLTMRNGYQWTGQPMEPELAKLTTAGTEDCGYRINSHGEGP